MLTASPKEGVTLCFQEAPEDAKDFEVSSDNILLLFESKDDAGVVLPRDGYYTFIATSNDITEEQAAELVEKNFIDQRRFYYRDYGAVVKHIGGFNSSKLSLFSLITSQGGDPSTKNYAILIKQ